VEKLRSKSFPHAKKVLDDSLPDEKTIQRKWRESRWFLTMKSGNSSPAEALALRVKNLEPHIHLSKSRLRLSSIGLVGRAKTFDKLPAEHG